MDDGSLPPTIPTPTDGVVRLRMLGPEDVPALVEQCRDPDTIRYTTVPVDYRRADGELFVQEAAEHWRRGEPTSHRVWAIDVLDPVDPVDPIDPVDPGASAGSAAAGPRFAGTIDYRPTGLGTAVVGYALHPSTRGRGVAARALRLLIEQAFAEEEIQLLQWRAVVGNWASRRAAWACGFRYEGRVRGLLGLHRGELVDGWLASLHRDDPRTPAHPWRVAPRLPCEGVRLRPWADRDSTSLPEERDELAQLFLGAVVPTRESFPSWLAGIREREAPGELVYWCLADPDTDAVLGGMLVFRLDPANPQGRFGYWLLPHARGRGVVARAAGSVLGWALTPADAGGLGLLAMSADADTANAASIRCLRRAGFREVGTRRRGGRRPDGAIVDLLEVDLLAGDPREAGSAGSGPTVTHR